MTRTMRGILSLVLLAIASGCHTPRQPTLIGPTRPISAKDYPDVLETWTRSTQIYRGLDNKLFVTATFHAPELRRAFAVAFPEIYGHGGEITKRELVDLTGDVEQYNNFFVAIYTPVMKWNDLAKADSIWRLTLIGSDEVAVDPKEVVAIKIDANLRAVYPYVGHFDKVYLVRFPLVDAMGRVALDDKTTHFVFRIASALGEAELRWDLATDPSATPTTSPHEEPVEKAAPSEVLEQEVGQ